jgi:uncharacterized protein YdeI (YjbR/CyaY-like superfamily)
MSVEVFARYRRARLQVEDTKKKVADLAIEIRETAREIANVAKREPSQLIPLKSVRALAAANELVAAIDQYHTAVKYLHKLQQRRAKHWYKRATRQLAATLTDYR